MQSQAWVFAQPRLPVRNGAHFDCAQDRFAQVAAREQRLERADGLVVPHVLVDGQWDAGFGAGGDNLPGLGVVHRQGLLGEDALNVAAVLDGLAHDGELQMRWNGDVGNFNRRVGKEFLIVAVDSRDVTQFGCGEGIFDGRAADSGDGIAGILVRDKMDVAHDEAGADRADAVVALGGARRLMPEIKGQAVTPLNFRASETATLAFSP